LRGAWLWRILLVVALLLLVPPAFVYWSLRGGRHELPGSVHPTPLPSAAMHDRRVRQQAAVGRDVRQILFGDLHVHTTFSIDAFQLSLPVVQGEGAHPPADACDFARFCSGLDFFAITDHAESMTPRRWQETKHSIRQCNAVVGRPDNPDLVAFVGWEWSQAGAVAEEHYGHKNVILRALDDGELPKRPIASTGNFARSLRYGFLGHQTFWEQIRIPLLDFPNRQRYLDMGVFLEENRAVPDCPRGVDTRELPPDCFEVAETPQELYEKLAQGGWETIVIPHGTTWGLYTPPGSSFDKQLTPAHHDPARQTLFEVYSGHGNSEEYRSWKAIDHDAAGQPVCPEPTRDYEPCCWRAGEIIRSRCGAIPADECERRVAVARLNYLAAGSAGRGTVPGAEVEDWKDCGQCRDCFAPAFSYRPGGSAQYVLALSNFDPPGPPRRFRFGFLASSDNHKARPGTGYKEYGRRMMTEATGARSRTWRDRVMPRAAPAPESVAIDPRNPGPTLTWADGERAASFFLTGGLVAVHSAGRGRDAIWAALQRREVYGTSGDRILLWFDLLNGPDGKVPMGSEVDLAEAPRFTVRAVGALVQRPGCPGWVAHELPAERLHRLCRGECYNPGDDRRRITRIEVVRVRPQQHAGEPVAPLIEDPWRRFPCPPDPGGCRVEFDDPEFVTAGRDAAYYVRAIEEPSPAVNARGLRCEYDAGGRCVRVHPCYGDYRTPLDDDCLGMNEERAWSSPIYVNFAEE
jgi:hypothetical protein